MAQCLSTGIPGAHDFICRQRGYAPEVQTLLRFHSGKETIYGGSSWFWYFIIADRSSTAVSAALSFIIAERSSSGFPALLEFLQWRGN
jgi:hypothetical protein